MSPLSNYCENTNLTPTNTCVTSWKLHILQFKMKCSQLKNHPKPTQKTKQWLFYNHYYFPRFCLSTWWFCHISFNSYATFQYHTWVDTGINIAQLLGYQPGMWIKTDLQWVCRWCQRGKKWSMDQGGCVIPILLDFRDSDKFCSNLIKILSYSFTQATDLNDIHKC